MRFFLGRAVRLAVIPFLSICSLVGTGFSLWLFAEEPVVLSESVAAGLDVAGRATLGTLTIQPPRFHDSYRLIFDQGSASDLYNEREGVYLSPSIECTLSGFDYEDVSDFRVRFEFACSSGTATCATLAHARLTDESLEPTAIGLSNDQIENGSIAFTLNPSFQWVSGSKPYSSSDWSSFIEEIQAENATVNVHQLTVVIDNGI